MKLIVKRIVAPATPGGFGYALCDESGEMLPGQYRCVVDTGTEGASVTVEFRVNGDAVRLEV